ncbi:MAG: response regulator [Isosphaeraceae bacterium]|nr:response regulator [Isosphaeraceae bacterium]
MSATRLLIIEDDEPALETMRGLFARGECRVETAASLAEGLEALDPPPDCLILDLKVPDGDGVAVLHRVLGTGLSIRVAVCTGMPDQEHLTAVAGLNPESLLGESVDLDALCRALGCRTV